MFYTKPYADLLIVVLILLLFFGPKRLPALGKSLGEGMREFKDSITGKSKDEDADRPSLEVATSSAPANSEPTTTASVSASSGQPRSEGASQTRS